MADMSQTVTFPANKDQCPHGRCKDHTPQWETESTYLASTGKYYWFRRCCGMRQERVYTKHREVCTLCGAIRVSDMYPNTEEGFCDCCHQVSSDAINIGMAE